MEYTIKKLAELAGISARTLRYYDEIGLLKPSRISSAGYRIYGQKQVDLLQQIMFYKSMNMSLEDIKQTVQNPNYNITESLIEHHSKLLAQKEQLEKLILVVEKTIASNKGEINMSNKEKFEAFKNEKIRANEEIYGKEIRAKYGDDSVNESYKRFKHLSKADIKEMNDTENEMIKDLITVLQNKDLNSIEAKKIYENHKKWLSYNMKYNEVIHRSLAEMYVVDERFAAYYNDKAEEDVVTLLRDIILKYCN